MVLEFHVPDTNILVPSLTATSDTIRHATVKIIMSLKSVTRYFIRTLFISLLRQYNYKVLFRF